jgi:hypothetical protein
MGTTSKPRLPYIHGVWFPLSQSLRSARPPDEGKREAGERAATLKSMEGGVVQHVPMMTMLYSDTAREIY